MYIFQNQIKPKSKTALIMCTYIRLKNMPKLLTKIQLQTNKDFDFYISNNAENQDVKLLNYFKKYGSDLGINVYVKNYNNLYKQFSRFYMAKELALQGYEKIIFVDDDEVLPSSFIQDCYNQYDPKHIKSFYAHKFEHDYWEKVKLKDGETGNYAGTGGLICSAKLFLDTNFFKCPEEYYIIDDLWLSYYVLNFTDYTISLLNTDIQFIHDNKGTFKALHELKKYFSNKYILKIEKAHDD